MWTLLVQCGISSLWGNICPLQAFNKHLSEERKETRQVCGESGATQVLSLLYLLNKYSFCVLGRNTHLGWRHRKPPNLSSFIQPLLLPTVAKIHSQWRKVANAIFNQMHYSINMYSRLEQKPVCVCMLLSQSCLTLCDPMDMSLSGSSVHGILQAIILEWAVILFSRGFSPHRARTQVFCVAGRFFTIWATREALNKNQSVSERSSKIFLQFASQ